MTRRINPYGPVPDLAFCGVILAIAWFANSATVTCGLILFTLAMIWTVHDQWRMGQK